MVDPEKDFSFQEPHGEKHFVPLGEQIFLATDPQQDLRIYLMEQAMLKMPIIGLIYGQSLSRAGLKPLEPH